MKRKRRAAPRDYFPPATTSAEYRSMLRDERKRRTKKRAAPDHDKKMLIFALRDEMDALREREAKLIAELKSTRRRSRARRNPAVRIVYNRLLGGWYVVRGPHQTPLNGRFDSRAEAQAWLKTTPAQRRNPAQTIKRGHASPVFKKRYRKHERFLPGAKFTVQVRRGKKWITLADFVHKLAAVEYGKKLKHRYPSKAFRVFW